MKLSTLLLLLEGKAFFPSVATLQSGDPLEGGLVPEPEWLISKLAGGEDQRAKLFSWLEENASGVERSFLRSTLDHTSAQMRSEILAKVYIRELAKRRAAWCWFREHHESAGMWSVYGGAGVAVVAQVGSLRQALPSNLEFQMADIRYVSRDNRSPSHYFNPEARVNEDLIHRPHLLKGIEYKNEQEFRVTTTCLPEERGRLVAGLDTATLVKAIIISPLLPFDEAEAIQVQVLGHRVWQQSRPEVRRSSLLGRIADEQERMAQIASFVAELTQEAEPEVPPPLNEL